MMHGADRHVPAPTHLSPLQEPGDRCSLFVVSSADSRGSGCAPPARGHSAAEAGRDAAAGAGAAAAAAGGRVDGVHE